MTDAELTALLPELPVPCSKSVRKLPRHYDAESYIVMYTAPGFIYTKVLSISSVGIALTEGGAPAYHAYQLGRCGADAQAAFNEFAA